MQSKRDQVQSHRFAMSRLNAAMQLTDPDAAETPLGRTSRNLVIGGVLGVIGVVGVIVFNLLFGAGTATTFEDGTLLTARTSGARFLYGGGALHPLSDYVSARLLYGDKLKTATVSWETLARLPRGAAVGLTGAPDPLPPSAALSSDPWQVCELRQTTSSGGIADTTVLQVATAAPADPLDASRALLAAGADGRTYLLWNGRRYRLDGTAVQALGYATVTPYPAGAALLNVIPAGPDLMAPAVAQAGRSGPAVGGQATRIGQLFVTRAASGDQYYQLRGARLVPITELTAELIMADPVTRRAVYGGGRVIPILLDAATAAGMVSGPADAGPFPETAPAAVRVDTASAACVRMEPHGGNPSVGVVITAASGVTGSAATGCASVDLIGGDAGHAVLAGALPAAGSVTARSGFLVTGGVKYPLAGSIAVKNLGYGSATPVQVPGAYLALLPTGVALDPAAVVTGAANAAGAAPGGPGGPGPAGSGEPGYGGASVRGGDCRTPVAGNGG